jgi:hypothetical protein
MSLKGMNKEEAKVNETLVDEVSEEAEDMVADLVWPACHLKHGRR